MGCQSMMELYALVFSGVVSLIGLALLGYGVYTQVQGDTYQELSDWLVVETWTAGLVLLIVGLPGALGIKYKNRILLLIHWIMILGATGLFVAGATAYLVSYGHIQDIADKGSEVNIDINDPAGSAKDTTTGSINDFQLAVYNTCCAAKVNATEALPCADPLACVEQEGTCGCVINPTVYDDHLADIDASALCDAMGDIEVDFEGSTVPLVGEVSEGGCGSGEPATFQRVLLVFFEEHLLPWAWVFFAMTAALLLQLVASCCAMCSKKEEYDPNFQKKKREQQNQTNGAAIAGTQGQRYV